MEAWPRVGCSRGIGAPRSRASEAWACRSQGGNRKDDAGDLAGLDAAAADFLPPGDVGAAQEVREQRIRKRERRLQPQPWGLSTHLAVVVLLGRSRRAGRGESPVSVRARQAGCNSELM